MFFEVIRAEGLNHLSYIVGDDGKAAVIDPRRDCRIYTEIAAAHGAKITRILETHRHEDFVSGSLELARRTKAKILHGNTKATKYGENTKEGSKLEFGNIELRILETPGHTPDSISITLSDKNFDSSPVAVFTGDTLFVGDVGRTDLYNSLREELSAKLYDSIHKKLLLLGDHVIIYPAHGEGSICGKKLATREFSTIGYERQFNPLLAKSRKEFVKYKTAEEHYFAPYFRQIEKFNHEGIPLVAKLPEPMPESAEGFSEAIDRNGMIVIDVRAPEAYAGAHIAGSLAIPLAKLPLLAGWFLPYDKKIGLVTDRDDDAVKAHLYLMRMGYDNAAFYLAGGMNAWLMAGKPFSSIPVIAANALKPPSGNKEGIFLLDVRSRTDAEEIPVNPQRRIWVGELPQHFGKLPRDRKIVTLCSTGQRAITAASLLRQAKFENVGVFLGSDKNFKTVEAPRQFSRKVS